MYKVDSKVMERIRFLCFMWKTPKSLRSHQSRPQSPSYPCPDVVRLVVAFVSYFEMTESSELKEGAGADLLDATGCLYKLGADKACHRWSFMLKLEKIKRERQHQSPNLRVTLNHGFKEVATSFGIMKFSTKISIRSASNGQRYLGWACALNPFSSWRRPYCFVTRSDSSFPVLIKAFHYLDVPWFIVLTLLLAWWQRSVLPRPYFRRRTLFLASSTWAKTVYPSLCQHVPEP